MELWLKRHEGRVLLVPEVSPPNGSLEYNGLKWVAVRYAGDTGEVKGATFVRRGGDGLTATPPGYAFPDD